MTMDKQRMMYRDEWRTGMICDQAELPERPVLTMRMFNFGILEVRGDRSVCFVRLANEGWYHVTYMGAFCAGCCAAGVVKQASPYRAALA